MNSIESTENPHGFSKKHLNSVQLLRAIAAIFVVLAHAAAHPLSQAPVWCWVAGRFGVTLFFVISGFIMVVITGDLPFSPFRFLSLRIVRILPIYWAVTIFTAVISLLFPFVFNKTIFSIDHIIGSLLFIPMWRPGNPGMIEPFVKLGWTLNYEIFFYVVFSIFFFLQSKPRILIISVFFISLVFAGQIIDFELAPLKFYTGYDLVGFFVGGIAGLFYLNNKIEQFNARFGLCLILFSCALLFAFFVFSETKAPRLDRQIVLVLICLLLLFGFLVLEFNKALLCKRWLLFVGDSSYSVYLIHMFPVGFVSFFGNWVIGGEVGSLGYFVIVFLGFVLGIFCGAVIYKFVEIPLLKASRRFVLN